MPPAATKACGSVHGAGGMPDAAARCSSVRRPTTGSSGVGGGSGTRVWRQQVSSGGPPLPSQYVGFSAS